ATFAKKPQNAAWRAYQILLAYAAASLLCIWYFELPAGSNMIRFTVFGIGPLAPGSVPPTPFPANVFELFNFANPNYVYQRFHTAQELGGNASAVLTV